MGVETTMAVGMLLGGVGSMASSMGGQGGVSAQIDPEVAAELAAKGVDMNEFQANLSAAQLGMNLPFTQSLMQYPVEAQRALQDAYSTGFGKTYGSLKESMEAAAKGEETAVTKNLLASMEQDVGRQYESAANQRAMELAQSGIDPSSPAYQAAMQDIEKAKRESALSQARTIRTEQAEKGVGQAMNFLQWGASAQKLPGTELPSTPLTAEQRFQQGLSPYNPNQLREVPGTPDEQKMRKYYKEGEDYRSENERLQKEKENEGRAMLNM